VLGTGDIGPAGKIIELPARSTLGLDSISAVRAWRRRSGDDPPDADIFLGYEPLASVQLAGAYGWRDSVQE
jgi:hypothetical protein